jgi:hypothetical protein
MDSNTGIYPNLPCLGPPPQLAFLDGYIWSVGHPIIISEIGYRCVPKTVLDSCLAPRLQQVRSLY